MQSVAHASPTLKLLICTVKRQEIVQTKVRAIKELNVTVMTY